MNCGERIAKLREDLGLTQGELAARLGITRASLSHYETNRRQPDYETLSALADFFDVSVDYLMKRTENMKESLTPDVSFFVDQLELSDEAILEKIDFTVDGRKLTAEEARRFIAFVRAERAMLRGDDKADS
ncbi:helix-turn-helix transcriptional regulator [Paenibacillus antri]|uniref:Helix-turn-helix transcriptional regulator n=1 Tax=Paenibacillus antri TaxID=2582848 RepID=A0A5R9G9M4_9BACL|nr:helix-turn-helix transcriptional regulator [Paenibacillus antri]TLS49423.1 helix-turn-helix transcriptional regulator [Paenibacillus antri]